MEVQKLREKEKPELVELLAQARKELVKLRADRKTGSLTDGSGIDKKRREIARILTVIGEKDILKEVKESEASNGNKTNKSSNR